MFRRHVRVMFVLIGLGASGLTHADAPPLTYGYIDFPPLNYTVDTDHHAGNYIRLLREIFADSDQELSFRERPIKRILHDFMQLNVDFIIGPRGHPQMDGKIRISSIPVNRMDIAVYHLPGTPAVQSVDQLTNEPVISLFGFAFDRLPGLANIKKRCEAYTTEEALELLLRCPCRYLINYRVTQDFVLRQYPKVSLNSHSLGHVDSYFIVAKHNPRAEQILQLLESGLQKQIVSGQWPQPQAK